MRIDAPRVRQALDNLLDNAVRHASGGGQVVLEVEVSDGQLRIAVENPGEQFPAWVLPRAGAGLGLAIVRAIAVAHGGDAAAENLNGSGARVAFTLAAEEAVPL